MAMYVRSELKSYVQPLSCRKLTATSPRSSLTLLCHAEGVKYEEQAIPYARVLINRSSKMGFEI
jgi:hypothetical protein